VEGRELRERREFILGRGNVGLGMSEWVWAIMRGRPPFKIDFFNVYSIKNKQNLFFLNQYF
jgi:hypothetical protein